MEPCGAWWRIKEACRRSYDMSVRLWKAALWVLSKYPPSLYKRGCGQSADLDSSTENTIKKPLVLGISKT
jgi:hypothetical protein